MINIAICDDNQSTVDMLRRYLSGCFKEYTNDFCIKTFTNGEELLQSHSKQEFQVLFLDIDMPDVTGFDVANTLREAFSRCYIVFVTSHSDLVYQSFDFQPFHFVRKNPVELLAKSLKSVVAKLMVNMKQNESISLEDELEGKLIIYYRDILYIKSERHYLCYYLRKRDTPVKIRGKLSEIEEIMTKHDFARIHRCYIINLKHILSVDTSVGKVTLNMGHRRQFLPMSKSYEKSFDEAYTMYLRESI